MAKRFTENQINLIIDLIAKAAVGEAAENDFDDAPRSLFEDVARKSCQRLIQVLSLHGHVALTLVEPDDE